MLSNLEFMEAIKELYPKSKELENEILSLFNKQCGTRGPTGQPGTDELSWTVNYLRSAANMLERIAEEQKVLEMKQYIVKNEVGCSINVFAIDEQHALEEYWKSLESILGHNEGTCDCFSKCKGNPKSFPREKYAQPISVIKRSILNLKGINK